MGNCIVGSFSQNRPLCLGQRFAGEVNDPLRVRIFIGRSLGGLVVLSSWETVLFSWEAWVTLCLLECLMPCLFDLFGLLDGPVWGEDCLLP